MVGPSPNSRWPDPNRLAAHFRLHGPRLRLRTIAAYESSSRYTIEVGTRFNYRDPDTGEWRIGYYDRLAGRFRAVSDDQTEIVTHFRCPERYVESLPVSDYA